MCQEIYIILSKTKKKEEKGKIKRKKKTHLKVLN